MKALRDSKDKRLNDEFEGNEENEALQAHKQFHDNLHDEVLAARINDDPHNNIYQSVIQSTYDSVDNHELDEAQKNKYDCHLALWFSHNRRSPPQIKDIQKNFVLTHSKMKEFDDLSSTLSDFLKDPQSSNTSSTLTPKLGNNFGMLFDFTKQENVAEISQCKVTLTNLLRTAIKSLCSFANTPSSVVNKQLQEISKISDQDIERLRTDLILFQNFYNKVLEEEWSTFETELNEAFEAMVERLDKANQAISSMLVGEDSANEVLKTAGIMIADIIVSSNMNSLMKKTSTRVGGKFDQFFSGFGFTREIKNRHEGGNQDQELRELKEKVFALELEGDFNKLAFEELKLLKEEKEKLETSLRDCEQKLAESQASYQNIFMYHEMLLDTNKEYQETIAQTQAELMEVIHKSEDMKKDYEAKIREIESKLADIEKKNLCDKEIFLKVFKKLQEQIENKIQESSVSICNKIDTLESKLLKSTHYYEDFTRSQLDVISAALAL